MGPRDRFITAPLNEGLIVARHDGDRLFVMNGSARFIWEKRLEGIPDADIPRLTATHYGIDLEQAQHDFCKTLKRWQAEGLAEPSERRREYRIGGVGFVVHYPNEGLEAAIRPILAHLEPETANEPSAAEFSLAAEEEHFILRADGIEVHRSRDIDALIDQIALSIVTRACNRIESLLQIHAAAVGTQNHCVLLPAESGSGKSTLTAALLASRRLRYLSEDASLLEPVGLWAMPVPSAIVLKSGSWEALGHLLPQLGKLPVWRRGGQEVRYWSPPVVQVATDPLPVRAIVFARYNAESERSHFVRLTPLEGLSRLIAAPSSVRTPITSALAQRIADWAEAVPFYALTYGSLSQATQIVEDLIGP